MEVVYERCAGLDVHKKKEHHGLRIVGLAERQEAAKESYFETFTRELLALADWLRECGVTHVAMESTGCTGSRFGTFWRDSSRSFW